MSGGRGPASRRGQEISELFSRRSAQPAGAGDSKFLGELLRVFPNGEPLVEGDLRILLSELCGPWGAERALIEGQLAELGEFWFALAAKTGSPYAHACYADTILVQGRQFEAIKGFSLALEMEPSLLVELPHGLDDIAREVGGEAWLHFSLAKLAALIAGHGAGDDDESREMYSELLEAFAGDSVALERIHFHGQALEQAVLRGDMPRALVRRSTRRSKN